MELQTQDEELFSSLQGLASNHLDDPGVRSWGEQGYSIRKGYEFLLFHSSLPPKSHLWYNIWQKDSHPPPPPPPQDKIILMDINTWENF
jgi:hypothetical protein